MRPLAAGAEHRGRQPRLLLGPDGVGCHLSPARGLEPGPAVHPPSPARHRWARPPAVAVGSERRTEEHTQEAEDTLLRPESSSRRNLRRARGRCSSSGFSLTFLRPSKITTTTTATHSPVWRTLETFSSVMVRHLLKPSTDFPLQMPNVPRLRLGPPGPHSPAWRAPQAPRAPRAPALRPDPRLCVSALPSGRLPVCSPVTERALSGSPKLSLRPHLALAGKSRPQGGLL